MPKKERVKLDIGSEIRGLMEMDDDLNFPEALSAEEEDIVRQMQELTSSPEDEFENSISDDEQREAQIERNEEFLNNYTRKLALLEAEKDMLEKQHQRRVAEVERRIKVLKFYNEDVALNIFQQLLAKQKGKSYDTPYMRISKRKSGGYVTVSDINSIFNNAEELADLGVDLNDLTVTTTRVNAAGVKKILKQVDGEIIIASTGEKIKNPEEYGLEVVEERETISFNMPKGK